LASSLEQPSVEEPIQVLSGDLLGEPDELSRRDVVARPGSCPSPENLEEISVAYGEA